MPDQYSSNYQGNQKQEKFEETAIVKKSLGRHDDQM